MTRRGYVLAPGEGEHLIRNAGSIFIKVDPRRGYLEGFEREPFLLAPENGFARFAYRGLHRELLQNIPIDHLKWACNRVLAITDRQWRDAFAAGNYDEQSTTRYVARIRAKAQEGLALP